jgi:hypothetical protein
LYTPATVMPIPDNTTRKGPLKEFKKLDGNVDEVKTNLLIPLDSTRYH